MTYTPQLKERGYYENRYDSLIVTQCRMMEDTHNLLREKRLKEYNWLVDPNEIAWRMHVLEELEIYFRKWALAENRDKRIAEWMEEDLEIDNFYEKTTINTPYCIYCNNKMDLFFKDLNVWYWKKKSRILFYFICEPCKYKRGVWDNGEEYKIEKNICERCKSEDTKTRFEPWKESDVYRTICNSCSYVKEEKWEHYKGQTKESDPDYEKDRERFILTEKDLYDFQDSCRRLNNFNELHVKINAENLEKEEGKVIDKKILDMSDMKDLILKGLRKFKYTDISLWTPSIKKKRVCIELTLFGKNLIKDEFIVQIQWILKNPNWSIDEKSVQIQLGILNCHLEWE